MQTNTAYKRMMIYTNNAKAAADRKTSKLTQACTFITIAAETMGAINSDSIEFLDDLGRHITQVTDDNREKAFLYQRLSVLVGTFPHKRQRMSLSIPADHMTNSNLITVAGCWLPKK